MTTSHQKRFVGFFYLFVFVWVFELYSQPLVLISLSRPQSWVSQNTWKEILANLHCGWGGRQLQIIRLSLRYVHLELGDVLCDKFKEAVYAFSPCGWNTLIVIWFYGFL